MGDNLIESMVDGFHIMPISKERGEMGESEREEEEGRGDIIGVTDTPLHQMQN